MKKLIYIWVNNYRNIVIQQGYQLSPEFFVTVTVLPASEPNLEISITDNRSNSLKHFYGSNISSVMAFVGKNGSGKTTVSRMLLEYLPDGVLSNDSLNHPEFLQSLHMQSNWDHRALYILYDDEKETISICPNDVSIQKINADKIEAKIFQSEETLQDLSSAVTSGIYLTNVFNPSEFFETYHRLDLGDGRKRFQQSYSPAFLLKHELEEQTKKLYGYRFNERIYINIIQKYAESQMNSLTFAYLNKQASLFLESYYNIPDKIKNELNVYQEFGLDVIDFGTINEVNPYLTEGKFNDSFERLEPAAQLLIHLKTIYTFFKVNLPQNIFIQLYFNMLLEVYGVVYRSDKPIEQKIDALLSNNISEIDSDILNEINTFLSESELKTSGWATQIIDFINFLLYQETCAEQEKITADIGNHSFKEEKLLNWYHGELTKETSFVKRNLIFRWKPTSSGEMSMANLFAYLHDAMQNLKPNEPPRNVLLIFDELDCYLHPKWQQYIVNMLFEQLQYYELFTFQVVITSHSPIILSDICKDNILKFDKFQAQPAETKTFGADISQLYYNSFFMDEGDIGEFAKKQISETIASLKQNDLAEEHKLLFIIDNIGQDVIRKQLRQKFQLLKRQNKHTTLDERINALDAEKREEVLNHLKNLERQVKENND